MFPGATNRLKDTFPQPSTCFLELEFNLPSKVKSRQCQQMVRALGQLSFSKQTSDFGFSSKTFMSHKHYDRSLLSINIVFAVFYFPLGYSALMHAITKLNSKQNFMRYLAHFQIHHHEHRELPDPLEHKVFNDSSLSLSPSSASVLSSS